MLCFAQISPWKNLTLHGFDSQLTTFTVLLENRDNLGKTLATTGGPSTVTYVIRITPEPEMKSTLARNLIASKVARLFVLGGLLTLTIVGAGSATSNRVDIGEFSSGNSRGWESKSFVGNTDYSLMVDGQMTVLTASSNGTASGLGRQIKIDLRKTPYVNWSWKVDERVGNENEKSKDGDDFAARLYVVKSGGALLWNTKALNYVWSENQNRGESWPNPYRPKNAIMVAARGIGDSSGKWVTEKRNVREDLKAAFGKDIKFIDAIAIMTDTDNTGGSAKASYGDIYFSAE